MKKLLTILGVIGIGVAPVMTVIACGENTDDKKNDDNDKVIDGNNNGINLDAEKILEIILGDGDDIVSGSNANETIQNFLKTFNYAFLDTLSKQDDKTKPEDKIQTNSPYANPELVETMKKSFEDFQTDVNSQWKDKIEKLEDTHKKDQAKMIEDLEKEFDRKLKTVEEYKPFFVYKKATSENNLTDSLNKILFQDFAKGTGNLKSEVAMNEVKSNVFNIKKFSLKQYSIDFEQNAKSLSEESLNDDTRKTSWYGQFDNWLLGINELSKSSDAADQELFNLHVGYLINLLNSTGGLNLEDFIAKNENRPMSIDDVVWATKDNVKPIYEGGESGVKPWSNKLLKRVDRNFQEHFGSKVVDGKTITVQDLNGHGPTDLGIPYIKLFNVIPDVMQTTTILPGTDNELAGLVSNSKRYLTNKYFEEKKPVAITEFVVAPFNSDPTTITTLDKEVTSKPFINATDLKYQGLYNFIKVFVNNKIDPNNSSSGTTPEDHTNKMFDGQSDYSWDVLLKSKGKLDNINEGNEWKLENIWHKFDEQLTETSHQLLTIDNNSKDDETLKYMVYDFLQSGGSKAEYNTWGTDNRKEYIGDFKISDLPSERQQYATTIAGLVHSMDRSGEIDAADKSEDNIYQVLNAEQGILSYVDGKGIHFVRIEGYPLLKKTDELTKPQTELKISSDQEMLKNYAAYYQIQENFNNSNSIIKNNTALITTDYLNRNTTAQNFTKVSYNDLNQSFGNKYLEFLFNASLPNIMDQGSGLAKYTFNLNNDVTSWASNSPSDDKYWTAQWEYIREIFGYASDEAMFDSFFKAPDATNNKIGIDIFNKYRKFVLNRVSNTISGKQATQKMANQWNDYQDQYKNRGQDNSLYHYVPWNYIKPDLDGEEFGKISKLDTLQNWKYDNSQPTTSYKIDWNKYDIFNQKIIISIVDGRKGN